MSNTEHYWRTYLPLTLATHVGLMILFGLLKCWKKIQKMLAMFQFMASLVWSLCCQNTQYLSFRAFVQLLASQTTAKGEVINLILCILVLFLSLFLAVSLPVLIQRKVLTVMFVHLNPRTRSFHWYISASLLLPFWIGFSHAFLSNCAIQLTVMLLLELQFVWVLVILRRVFFSKTVLLFTLIKQALRVTLQVVLLVENYASSYEDPLKIDSFASL